jgi:DNA polymerase III delta prime subunit
MPATLATIAKTYGEDETFHQFWKDAILSRDTSLTTIRPILDSFIAGQITIEKFREEITKALRSTNNWGATGTAWLMEINKLQIYYGPVGEQELRRTLDGLNAGNLGERIEAFHKVMVAQKIALKASGKPNGTSVNPGNSAMLVSLFAFWLDRDSAPPIYYVSFRRGLRMLLDAGLLPRALGMAVNHDAIIVTTAAQHRAVIQALELIATAEPQLVDNNPYWKERFLLWITEHADVLLETEEANDDAEPTLTDTIIANEPLAATPETLVRTLIADLQSRLLIEEAVVRRIYHALLAGHVILSGPPGTGKTELARLIPELLWQSVLNAGSNPDPFAPSMATERTTQTAYATSLVTATDEWSVRTLIGGIAPSSESGQVSYRIQYGHLTKVILENWAVNEANPAGWQNPQRKSIRAASTVYNGELREFRGRWLVIDEFNRAPIDLALGEALTALGGSGALRVPIDHGSAELPLPKDFRIIGTLNSFDRNYLNQISEALKRRFSFIEVLPPTRAHRSAEQAIVLAKALAGVEHLAPNSMIRVDSDQNVTWQHVVTLSRAATGGFTTVWATPAPALHDVFTFVWNVFEVIRIYRQLGTAQAISLLRQILIAGIVQNYTTVQQWVDAADMALCDTIADQLQVLLPDELEVLIDTLSAADAATFTKQLNATLLRLLSSPRRLAAQIAALNAIVDDTGTPIVALAEDLDSSSDQKPQVSEANAIALFHWQNGGYRLPAFVRRLRIFKTERGL